MKAPLAYCSKATKKNVRYAREKTRKIEACTSAQGAQKKTGKGSPLSAVTLQKIDKHATEASQKLNYAHSQWNFSEYTVQGEPWPKKNAGTKCNDGKFYCPDKKHFFMDCQISNRLRELILRCSALKNHYWKTNPLNHKIICPIMVPYWILDINFIRFIRKGCNHKNCLLVNLPSTKYWPKNCLSFKLAPIENQFQCEVS